jgi:hypothetical protein
MGGAPGGGASSRRAAAEEADLVAALVNQVVKILDHPLTWLCMALGLLGWLFAVVMSSLARRNSR